MRSKLSASLFISGLFCLSAQAQIAPADAADPKTQATQNASPWTRHGIDIYLLGDGYLNLNFNHPENGFNKLYNFNDKANTGHLNFAKIALEKPTGILGFRIDAGFGRTLDQISATDTADPALRFLEQFYIEFRPPKMHGLQLDFGKFVTSAGAEVTESNLNWLYSRALLFFAGPYYHFGLRASMPVTKSLTAGFQVVDGWNNVGTTNGFSTVGLTGTYAWKKVTWANTYYFGRQLDGLVMADRKVVDSNVFFRPNDATGFYVDFEYASNRRPAEGASIWYGVAVAGRRQVTKHLAFAARGEFLRDPDGYATTARQTVKEVAGDAEWKFNEHLVSRLEYRRDMSNVPFFDRGANMMVGGSQNTLTLALMAFFGPTK